MSTAPNSLLEGSARPHTAQMNESGRADPILFEPPRRQERQDETPGTVPDVPPNPAESRIDNVASDLCGLGVLGGSNLTVL